MRPTWTSPGRVDGPAWPCTGRGLPCAPASPRRRCALTAPFHLCLCATHVWPRHRPSALCGTFPRVSPGGRYPPPSPFGVRTFLEGLHLRDCLARRAHGRSARPRLAANGCALSARAASASWRELGARRECNRSRSHSSSPLQTGQSARPSERKPSQAPRTTSSSVTSDGSNNLCALPRSCGRFTTAAVSVATATLTRPSGRRRRRDRGSGRRGCEVASCSCSPAAAGRGPSP